MRFLASLLIIACENNDLRRSAMKLGLLVKVRTGKLDANAAVSGGCYPFFTCSKEVSEIDTYAYDCECVLVAGNGDLNVKYYNGKFNAYQRTYIVERASSEINMRYLYHFLSCYVDVLRRQSIGGVIKYIKLGNLTEADIKLPDKETQERISMILDRLTHLISLRQRQAEKLDELVKARFVDMFWGAYSEVIAEDVCEKIVDCPHSTPKYNESELKYPAIRTSEIQDGQIEWSSMKYVGINEYQRRVKRLIPEAGDIVYAREGTYGDCVILPEGYQFCLGQRTMLFRPNYKLCNSEYLHAVLRSAAVKYQADMSNAGSTVPHVNVSDAKRFHFPLPPLPLQNAFATFVHEVDCEKERIQRSAALLKTLKRSLMQQYFG